MQSRKISRIISASPNNGPGYSLVHNLWKFNTGDPIYSSPAVADGKVYIGSYDGKVYCLDARVGRLLWSYQTDDIIHSSPAVADNMVFVGSYDGNPYCFGPAQVTPPRNDCG
jgi:outer membrane protein assembly factor BamB